MTPGAVGPSATTVGRASQNAACAAEHVSDASISELEMTFSVRKSETAASDPDVGVTLSGWSQVIVPHRGPTLLSCVITPERSCLRVLFRIRPLRNDNVPIMCNTIRADLGNRAHNEDFSSQIPAVELFNKVLSDTQAVCVISLDGKLMELSAESDRSNKIRG